MSDILGRMPTYAELQAQIAAGLLAHAYDHGDEPEADISAAIPAPFINADGTVRIENVLAHAQTAPMPVPVAKSVATARPLFSNGSLGVDLLYVPPLGSFPVHIHPGDHMLYCLRGEGTITLNGGTFEVRPGDLYMIPGGIEHAVGAGAAGHWLLSIGSPHVPVLSRHRMVVVEPGVDYSDEYEAARKAYHR